MKILMCNKFHFVRGGTERYLFDVSEGLKRSGHTVIHFSTQDARNFDSEYAAYFHDARHMTAPLRIGDIARVDKAIDFIYSFRAKRDIGRLIGQYKPEIAHLHNIYHHFSSSILHALRSKNIPIVMTVHDYKLICPNYSLFTGNRICRRCKNGSYYNAVRFTCVKGSGAASFLACAEMYFCKITEMYERNIDLFIAPTNFVRNTLIDFGIDKRKIAYVPSAINLERFNPRFGAGRYILYFGAIHYKKGVHLLLEVAKNIKNIPVKIVGEGPYLKELQKLALGQGLTNVEFLGHKPLEQLMDIIAGASLVVVPSLYYEVTALVLYEALASGRCVVASNIGGIPEIIKDGVNGVLFRPGDGQQLTERVAWLLDNPKKTEELAREGFRGIKEFNNMAGHCQRLTDIYRGLIAHKG